MKPGFKLTEVGIIPDDWTPDYIENFAAITTGSKNTQDRVEDGQYPFFVRSQTVERINSYSFDGEAVLTAGDGVGTGKVFHYINGKFDTHQRVYRISDFAERVNGYFFYLYFSTHFYNRIMQMTAKSSVDSVRRDMISRMQVALPPTEAEQRAIATALSDGDGLLGGLDRLIAKKRDLKQAAMQQLLTGQTRLPGFSGEWEVKRLGEICEIAMGRTPPRLNQAFWGHGYKWLSIADLQTKVVSDSKEEITELAASTMTIIPKGTLLMSFKLSLGRLCFAGCDLFSNEAICSFGKLQAHAEFLYYVLGRTDFSLYGKQAVKGYTLNKESLKIIEVTLPPLHEQTAIAEVLTEMDGELAVLELRREKTRALKQAMMQELLTGRTRLVSPEDAHA